MSSTFARIFTFGESLKTVHTECVTRLRCRLQEDAFVALCSLNKWILRKDIVRSVGKKINGIVITESGILAAAHLSGAGNVKKYLRSYGQNTFKDAYGSSIQHYMKLFSGYDTSFIQANRKPTV